MPSPVPSFARRLFLLVGALGVTGALAAFATHLAFGAPWGWTPGAVFFAFAVRVVGVEFQLLAVAFAWVQAPLHAANPPGSRRRVRATFLLRCAILLACIAMTAIPVLLGVATGWTATAVLAAIVIWLVGIETDLLPGLLVFLAERRAAGAAAPASSLWFTDVGEERRRRLARFHAETEDNPTLR